MAIYQGFSFNVYSYTLGQVVIILIQLMVHYSNDYFDIQADLANKTSSAWSGGSGILRKNLIHPKIALLTSVALLSIALLLVFTLVILGMADKFLVAVILSGLFLSWFYSAPPLHLHSRGLGEISATVVLTVLSPIVGFYLQAHTLSEYSYIVLVPVGLLQLNMLIAVAIPDREGDETVGKRTLVVILGEKKSKILYFVTLCLYYICIVIFAVSKYSKSFLFGGIILIPLSGCIILNLFSSSQARKLIPSLPLLSILMLQGVTLIQIAFFLTLNR